MDSIVEENGNSAASSNVNDDNGPNLSSVAVAMAAAAAQQQQANIQPPPHQQQQQQQQHHNQQSTTLAAGNVSAGTPQQTTNALQQQQQQQAQNPSVTGGSSISAVATTASVLTTTSNVVQYPLTALAQHGLPVQSVIQAANQSSVIQTAAATNSQTLAAMHKSGVLYVSKPNTTVIHTTAGNAVQIPPNFACKIKPEPNTQPLDSNSDDSLTDDDSPHRRNELTRRPSYNKIFTEISGPDISGTTLQMSESGGLSTLPVMGGGSTANSLIHMPQDGGAFYLSNRMYSNNSVIAEDQTRKREIRLQKNREAARECRRKKKEYIKCLENRVAVLENQNKALIEELKSLKELYCQTKNE